MSEQNKPDQTLQKDGVKRNEREVTDPVTHLPLIIHDADSIELEQIPPPPTTSEAKQIDIKRGANTQEETNARHHDMETVVQEAFHGNWWEDPIGDQRRTKVQTSIVAAVAAATGAFGSLLMWSMFSKLFGTRGTGISWVGLLISPIFCCILGLLVGFSALSLAIFQNPKSPQPWPRTSVERKDFVSPALQTLNKDETAPESAQWLNSLLNSVWPIVNPSLFVAVADMLEDTMQATLPKLVRGVRVADIGQGSQSIRILGIRWLDAGSAAKDVDGMKAEEGDFFNMEVAIAYRAKETTAGGIRGRSANAHLLMEFWVTGGMMIPVWVEMTGLLATIRIRVQLTPNPPFLSLMTLTLLGLPKVSLKCTPLAKNFFNVMDVPGLSHWLQNSINLAVEEYVAPRSLTLDLKTLLMGAPKMDTDAIGVIIVTVRRIEGCKHTYSANILKSDNGETSDLYVTLGWSKWGKPLWSTRIITAGEPIWEETTALLVGPSELNAQERLQLQVWDSDRFTVDDLVGNVELTLSDVMNNADSHNRMSIRADNLTDEKGSPRPGTLHWECGYFEKTTFEQHVEHKHQDAQEIRAKIEEEAENKLREAKARGDDNEDSEVAQQKKEDVKEKTDEIISASKPTTDWPSGIVSIRIEQINGLELEKIKDSEVREEAETDDGDDLPSAYCTIILNQQSIYKTRTKMKNSNPYYDAGTEKFIRDWRNTDIIISVRDSRLHEADPVIGIVVLPLREVFSHRSEFVGSLPLVGGIGYGRMRLSLMFRSVQLHLPKRFLGWDIGTLEIMPHINASPDLPEEYKSYRLSIRTLYGKGKMVAKADGQGWETKRGKPIRLPVKKRFASCLLIQLRKRVVGPDLTPAFATLWLKEIPDDEELKVTLPISENTDGALDHAQRNATTKPDKQLGTLELTLRLWPGLSGYHKLLADHDDYMADVMEVLDYAESTQATSQELLKEENRTESLSSSDSSSSDEDGDGIHSAQSEKDKSDSLVAAKKGVVNQVKDFRKKRGELHRKHRGLMQWKAARNMAWIGRGMEHQAEKLTDTVKGTFKHQNKEVGIEKEV